jgi:hypothetical protein
MRTVTLLNTVNPHYDGQNLAGHLVFKQTYMKTEKGE